MKKILIVFLMVALSYPLFAQMSGMRQMHERMRQRHSKQLRMLEKMKLIDYLNLNEDDAVKFSVRLNKFFEIQDSLSAVRKNLVNTLADKLEEKNTESFYKKSVNEIFSVDRALLQNKKDFLGNLTDFLSQEQIAKIVVFQSRFKNDLMKMMLKRRGGINPKDFPSREE